MSLGSFRLVLLLLLCRAELSIAETVHAGRTSQADQPVLGCDPTSGAPLSGPKQAADALDEVIVQGAPIYVWHHGFLRQPSGTLSGGHLPRIVRV